MQKSLIGFVILHYQAIEETRMCVRSIRTCVPEHKIVIVDNASPNKSGAVFRDEYRNAPDVAVVLNSRNLGYAAGNNIGYRMLRDDCGFIVVLNSDVEIQQKDFADKVEGIYQSDSFDILGPDIYSTRYGIHQNPQRERNFTLDELKKKEKALAFKVRFHFLLRIKYAFIKNSSVKPEQRGNYLQPVRGAVLHGACYIFSEKYIKAHEFCFYDKTFLYFESYILHYLAMKENLILLYSPEVKVVHHEDASTNAVYKEQYSKSVFMNQCMLDSCRVFIRLLTENEDG